jgi:SAM-dependent methyltransferase
MEAYGPLFASIYDRKWAGPARKLAPKLLAYYSSTPLGRTGAPVLDLCCGTGQLALHFLRQGYRVTGLDRSAAMLAVARRNAAPYMRKGMASFVQADARSFLLPQEFGLVASTFYAVNHMAGLSDAQRCFASVYACLLPGGHFIFDLRTKRGLRRWENISLEDNPELTILRHGIFDEELQRATIRFTGFVRQSSGLYARFEEILHNYALPLAGVEQALLEVGFRAAYCATDEDLTSALLNPEARNQVLVVARK